MISKSFRLHCWLRALLLAVTLLVFAYLILETRIVMTAVIVGVIAIIQVVSLIRYIETTNRDLTRFLDSIRYSDFSESFTGRVSGKTFDALNEAFAEVIAKFRRTRSEREEQYRYLQTIIQHIGLGIISFEPDGTVDLINNAAKNLLKVSHLKNVKTLAPLSENLVGALLHCQPGERRLVKIEDSGETMTLVVYPTRFRLRDRAIILVSMQNIESELAEQEMDAWQKLIRVLTHEIMNSITPISSLASTVNTLLRQSEHEGEADVTTETIGDIRQAAATIEKRSNGLLHFVDAYRDLTRIPKPAFELVAVNDFIEHILQLMKNQIEAANISCRVSIVPDNLKIVADPELIEQVMINLIVNAISALQETDDPQISVAASLNSQGRAVLSIADNGPGLERDIAEKIFTPFFTTKKDGSGIGLSLSRQIMRLHKGNISVQSTPNHETKFILRF